MELVDEMESNLNAAHFCERRADSALEHGLLDDAVEFYRNAIVLMQSARVEMDDDAMLVDVQLAALRKGLTRALLKKNSSNDLPVTELTEKSPSDACRHESVLLMRPVAPPTATKFPKCEQQTKEELKTCMDELRRWLDVFSKECELGRQELEAERARRLAAEAELLASQVYSSRLMLASTYSLNLPDPSDSNSWADFVPSNDHSKTCAFRTPLNSPSNQSDIWFDASNT
ncbi:hypothetical protein P879_07161 [Paragonimus westermani]|uniref:Nuclear receptor-binding factor 2 MIT domain-containing protein n=1 Tax=Paragonimus westermani TaxID=34504 RepID=A0A8T0DDC8_9TREM|nr:hypothetical protein P879_07161 [Paragonimus westermani]